MNIGLDWDNTFTADPVLYQIIVDAYVERGHTVYITTSRGEDTPIEFRPRGIKSIIYCNFRAKRDVTLQMGIKIHNWIDDDPYYITTGFVTDGNAIHELLKGHKPE